MVKYSHKVIKKEDKMNKKMSLEKKKAKKIHIITLSLLSALVLIVLVGLIFGDAIGAAIRFSSMKKDARECYAVIVRDPLVSDGMTYTATEEILRGEDAIEIMDSFFKSVEGATYKKAEKALTGDWDIHLEFVADGGRYVFYLLEDSVYISKNGIRSVFKIKNSNLTDYRALLSELEELTALEK